MNLNLSCIKIKLGDDPSALFSDTRIQSIMHGAVSRILRKNPNYDHASLMYTLKNELWDEIKRNYVGASDLTKGDNLVLRFVKTVAYNRLLNFVRKDKGLIWSLQGYSKKYNTIDIEEVTERFISEEDVDSKIDRDSTKHIVRKSLQEAVETGRITSNDAYILILKFKENMEHSKIQEAMSKQFDIHCSVSWISQRVAKSIKELKPILIKNKIGAYV